MRPGCSLTARTCLSLMDSCWTAGAAGAQSPLAVPLPQPSTPPPAPSISLRPRLPHQLLVLSSEMRRCEGYEGTRDRLAGKMDEGAGGQQAPRAGRAGQPGRGVQGGLPACVRVHACVCARAVW